MALLAYLGSRGRSRLSSVARALCLGTRALRSVRAAWDQTEYSEHPRRLQVEDHTVNDDQTSAEDSLAIGQFGAVGRSARVLPRS